MVNGINGEELPRIWAKEAVVHVSKNKGCGGYANYRPICLLQIEYKICERLAVRRLVGYTLTGKAQFGEKATSLQ